MVVISSDRPINTSILCTWPLVDASCQSHKTNGDEKESWSDTTHKAIHLLKNTHNKHPIARQWVEIWGHLVSSKFVPFSIFLHQYHHTVSCHCIHIHISIYFISYLIEMGPGNTIQNGISCCTTTTKMKYMPDWIHRRHSRSAIGIFRKYFVENYNVVSKYHKSVRHQAITWSIMTEIYDTIEHHQATKGLITLILWGVP